jgi:hypothetical protein
MPSSSPIVGYLIAPNECFLLTEDQFGDLAFIEPQSLVGLPPLDFLISYTFFGTMPLGAEIHNASGSSTGVAFLQSGTFAHIPITRGAPCIEAPILAVLLLTDTETVIESPSAGGLTGSVVTTESCEGYNAAPNGRVTTKSGLEVTYAVSETKAVSISLQSGNPNPTMRVVQE